MESRRINTEVSRTINGNLSSAWGGWEFSNPNFVNLSAVDEWRNQEAPRRRHNPVYEVRIEEGWAFNNLAYRDLSVFPSVFRFEGDLEPFDYTRYMLYGAERFWLFPFSWMNPTTFVQEWTKPGGPIVVDSEDQYGEYRIQKIGSPSNAIVVPSAANPQPTFTGEQANYEYKEGYPYSFTVDIGSEPGVSVGEMFACERPACSGLVKGVSGSRLTIQPLRWGSLIQSFPPPTYSTGTPVQRLMGRWKIEKRRPDVSMFRTIEAALYDLTLAYTLRTDVININPSDVYIQLMDELDEVQYSLSPRPVDGTNVYIDKPIEGGRFVRRFQRFVFEHKYPIYGRIRVGFYTTGRTTISNVNLYRGNYLERVFSEGAEKSDFIESQIDVNSEIVPKGTIIAYTGGHVCPPGFHRVEGVGVLRSDRLGQGKELSSEMGDPNDSILEISLDDRTSRGKNDPRTIIKFDLSKMDRTLGVGTTYQRSRRLVDIIPFRYGPSHHLYVNFITMRTVYMGDPHPIWVTDEYDRTDIQPGCILEVQLGPDSARRRHFMIISQYAQGRFISVFKEALPQYPFGRGASNIDKPSDDRRRALRQKNAGIDRNQVFRGYAMYGEFIPQYDDRAYLEVVGDWRDVIEKAQSDSNARMRVWKSGVIAQAQTHPELGDDDCYGGYGLWAEPHSHYLGLSNAGILTTIITPQPHWVTKVPLKHRHGWLFGAATIPSVRPVLLCQKI